MNKKIFLLGAGILGATLLLKKITAMSGLVAYWKCDEGEGNILKDSSGNKNDGIISGAEWVEGVKGKALYFNGINNYVLIPSDYKFPLGSTDRTISVWINPIPSQSSPIIFEYGTYVPYQRTGFGLRRMGEEHVMRFIAHERYHNINATELFGSGWHHLVWVIKDKKLYFYVDNVLDGMGEIDLPSLETVSSGEATIGIQLDFRQPFKGIIDEIKIFDRSLDVEEIKKV